MRGNLVRDQGGTLTQHGVSYRSPERVWQDEALCLEVGVEMFFPLDSDSRGRDSLGFSPQEIYRAAKEVCAQCPVRMPCLEQALQREEEYGVWGGLTPFERRRVLRARNRTQARAMAASG